MKANDVSATGGEKTDGPKINEVFVSAKERHGEILFEVYNARGALNEKYRKETVEKLNVCESYPAGIPHIDFTLLIPEELRDDPAVMNDLSKKLCEAVRHKQRIARANFICEYKSDQLMDVFERYSTQNKDILWKKLTDLINETKYEELWTGSMPSVEWFLRRRTGIISKGKGRCPSMRVVNGLLVGTSKSTGDGNEEMKMCPSDCFSGVFKEGSSLTMEYNDEVTNSRPNAMELLNLYSASFLNAEEADETVNIGSVNHNISAQATPSVPIQDSHINTYNASPTPVTSISSKPQFIASSSIAPNKDEISRELEMLFSRMPPAKVRSFMMRLRTMANHQLAQDAADLLLLLNSADISRVIEELQSIPQ